MSSTQLLRTANVPIILGTSAFRVIVCHLWLSCSRNLTSDQISVRKCLILGDTGTHIHSRILTPPKTVCSAASRCGVTVVQRRDGSIYEEIEIKLN